MKQLIIVLIMNVSVVAMDPAVRDKARESAMADSPPSSQKSVIIRETEYESFDCVFERPRLMHTKMCTCVGCLEQAHRDLELIASKLAILKEKKVEAGPEALAAARVVAKLLNMAKDCQNSPLGVCNSPRSVPRSNSPARAVSPDRFGSVKSPQNPFRDQEFESLTDPDQENFKWRLKDAGLI